MNTLKNWFHNFKFWSNGRAWSQRQSIDFVVLATVLVMVLFGLIMVYSSSFIFAQEKTGDGFAYIRKQVIFAGLGFVALLIASQIDYRRWANWSYPILGIAFFLLSLMLIPGVGVRVGGARRWIQCLGFRFQPGEFAKFAVIFFVASQLHRKHEKIENITAGILSHLIVPLPILFLLLLQPDFGTTVMISVVIFVLMFVAGVPTRRLLVAQGVVLSVGLWLAIGTAYRRARLMTFLDPWMDPGGKGFQILQSYIGIHNGGFWGAGLGSGKEKLFYLPEAHNDFLFSVIAEELGFIGIFTIISVYLYFIYRGLRIAWNSQKINRDRFGMLLATGITTALGFQSLVNIAVVFGLVPTKGLTLPFMSYGGSALLVDLFAVGVLLSVSRGPSGVHKL